VNPVDLLLFVLLAACAVRGFVRGLFREVMGLAGLVLGTWAAMLYYERAAALMRQYALEDPMAAQVVAGVVIFLVVNVASHVVAVLLDRLARAVYLTSVTRMAGAVVGIGKGAVLVSFLLLFLRAFAPVPGVAEVIGESTLGAPLAEAAERLLRRSVGAGEGREA
jgi:membrane protein required for colicin V production